ncbi:MAG: RNA ligase, partial [Phascolarctobacterium sp.]|nr:RNA ligase [Phascolarctobacterium sp.]
YVRDNNCSVIFECIEPVKDPHIIEYQEPQVVLLEIIPNELEFKHSSYNELKALGAKLGVKVKELACTLQSLDEFDSWLKEIMRPDYLYNESYIEGFVIEDAQKFMTKLKLHYYKKWKTLRQVADATLKHGAIKAKWKLSDEEAKAFYNWLREEVYPLRKNDGTYTFATDIISLRKMFLNKE